MQLTNPWIEAGRLQGRQEGLQKWLGKGIARGRLNGEIELVLRQLVRRLGSVADAEKSAVLSLPPAKLGALGEALLRFDSCADLVNWLRRNQPESDCHELRERFLQLIDPWIEEGKLRGRQEGLQKGLDEGYSRGRQQGQVEIVLRQLGRRLGRVSAAEKKAVRMLPLAKIEALGEALLQFDFRADLTSWLRQNR